MNSNLLIIACVDLCLQIAGNLYLKQGVAIPIPNVYPVIKIEKTDWSTKKVLSMTNIPIASCMVSMIDHQADIAYILRT